MRNKLDLAKNIRAKCMLALVMLLIGIFTAFAAANTYEVVAKNDLPLSDVIKLVSITNSSTLDSQYRSAAGTNYDTGSFGVPKKIKLSETKQHIDIIPAKYSSGGWTASAGLAQVFITSNKQQKIFGEAVIYLRYNTSTTQYLGDVLNGDIVNIVTTEGWQLGYRVQSTGNDPVGMKVSEAKNSRITVIMMNDDNNKIKSFSATLAKVGDRI